MKLLTKIIGAFLAVNLGVFFVQAGDHHFSSSNPSCSSCCESSKSFYIFGFGGGSFFDDASGIVLPANAPLEVGLSEGVSLGGGIGWRSDFLGGSRFEIEGAFTDQNVESVVFNNNNIANFAGEIETYSAMVNFIKEFRGLGNIVPYIGAGIGYTEVDSNFFYNGGAANIVVNDTDGAFTWQLIAGLEFKLSDRLGLYAEYNYTSISDDISLARLGNGGAAGGGFDTVAELDDFSSHGVQGGFRFSF